MMNDISKLHDLHRNVIADPMDKGSFLSFLHYHARCSGLITMSELNKTRELLSSDNWLPGRLNRFLRVELIHKKTGIEFVMLPTGSYIMGHDKGDSDCKPAHEVIVPDVHLIGKYLVTQDQWMKMMDSNPSLHKAPDHPVESVSWDLCKDFMSKSGLSLPPENGWEYACRAGVDALYHAAGFDDPSLGGDDDNHLSKIAVFGRDHDDLYSPVGTKQPNSWGIYDMLGNVWEWTDDTFHENLNNAPPTCRPWDSSWDNDRSSLIRMFVREGILDDDRSQEEEEASILTFFKNNRTIPEMDDEYDRRFVEYDEPGFLEVEWGTVRGIFSWNQKHGVRFPAIKNQQFYASWNCRPIGFRCWA